MLLSVAPMAQNDGYSVEEDTTLSVLADGGVLANDTDVDGDTLSAVLASGPSHGALTLESDGSFIYTPNAHFFGTDSFTYRGNDGAADSDAATVTITVNPGADPFIVSTITDESDGDYSSGDLSLREALALAAVRSGDDVVQFDNSLAGGTITLDAALGQLEIDSNVEIQGLGADQLTIDADGNSRVFEVASGVTATLSGLTITGGLATSDVGGGAIYGFNITLVITNSVVSENFAPNSTDGRGGGIYVRGASTLSITNTTIAGNSGYWGGGVYAIEGSTVTVQGSTISGNTNTNGTGGAFRCRDSLLTITNSTISGNSSDGMGGGIYGGYGSTLTITNSTIFGNDAGYFVGGIGADPGGVTTLHNTIVAGNTIGGVTPGDVLLDFEAVSSNNLIGVIDGSTGLDGGTGTLYGTAASPLDAMLGPLADNGGPTLTHACLASRQSSN